MRMGKKIKEACGAVLGYVRSHISTQVTLTVVILLLLAGMVLQSYVKNMYFQFLLKDTRETVQSIVDVSAVNLNNKLKEVLNISCTIAIDDELLKSVDSARFSGVGDVRPRKSLGGKLGAIIQYNGSIATATVATADGVLREASRNWADQTKWQMWQGDNEMVLKELYEDVMGKLQNNTVIRYSLTTKPLTHGMIEGATLFHIAVPLIGQRSHLEEQDSMLVITFRLDKIYDTNELTGKTKKGILTKSYLVDQDGTIISHEDPKYIGVNVKEYQKLNGESEEMGKALDYFGWTSYVSIDVEAMREEVDLLYQNSIYVYIILLLCCAMIWQFTFRRLLHPLADIRKAMETIQLKGKMPRVEVKGSHEIWQLAEHYNKMTDELEEQREQINRHYEEKTMSIELRNKAEREALESQINAHFLCNTLTAINYDAVENGDYEVAAHLKKLSAILSYVFSKKQVHVTLGQEIQWVEQYLYLQKFRLMDVFDYIVDFPEEYGEWPCCKLFLQPFVENSILHGFEGKEHGGLIKIVGKLVDKRFMLMIVDNGCGMDAETEAEMQNVLNTSHTLELAGNGIGIRNVVTRLKMFYGKGLDIQLETAPGKGTCFTFWLPLLAEQTEGE